MKIAVTYENGSVFQHFGHCQQFKVYEVENKIIKNSKVENANGSGHGALAGFLQDLGVDILICGGIGMGARLALDEADIQLYAGVKGNADQCVAALLAGVLPHNPNATCNHHHDHDHDHDCGSHDCGSHHCGDHDHHCGGH